MKKKQFFFKSDYFFIEFQQVAENNFFIFPTLRKVRLFRV